MAQATGQANWTPVRVATLAAGSVVAVALLYQSFVIDISRALFSAHKIAAAVGANPRDGVAAGNLAWSLQRAGTNETATAQHLARFALDHAPLSPQAIGVLAVTPASPDPAMLQSASAAGWRDPSVQEALARQALAAGDDAAAAIHIDAAARIADVTPPLRHLIDAMADTPGREAAMGRRLAIAPWWRHHYFFGVVPPRGSMAARLHLLAAIEQAGGTLDPSELPAVVDITAASQGLPAAYDIWYQAYRPADTGPVNDPDFAAATAATDLLYFPFGWTIRSSGGEDAEVDKDGARSALHASTDGSTVAIIATQTLRLAPGRHALSVEARYDGPGANSAFRWEVACTGNKGFTRRLAPINGSQTGKIAFDFDVPNAPDCPLQTLVASTQQADTPGAANAWFRSVSIK